MAKIRQTPNINWIVRAFYNPCDSPAWIWIECAFPAALLAIWEYLQPGWKDIVDYASGHTWVKHGKQNIGAQALKEPTWKARGVSALFEAAEELDKRAWQIMVLELLFGAYIRWHSMVWSMGPCDTTLLAASGKSKLPIDGRPTNYDWQTGVTYFTEQGTMVPYIGQSLTVQPGAWCYWVEFSHFSAFITGQPLKVEVRIIRQDTGQPVWEYSQADQDLDSNDGAEYRLFHVNKEQHPITFISEVRLLEGQFPLVWSCESGFCAMGYGVTKNKFHDLQLPTVMQKSVRTRHAIIPGKAYRRKKADKTDTNDDS